MDQTRLYRIVQSFKTMDTLKRWAYTKGYIPNTHGQCSARVGFCLDTLVKSCTNLKDGFTYLAHLCESAMTAFAVVDGEDLPRCKWYEHGDPRILAALWDLVEILGFQRLKASGDADALLAQWSAKGQIDAVISSSVVLLALAIFRTPSAKSTSSKLLKLNSSGALTMEDWVAKEMGKTHIGRMLLERMDAYWWNKSRLDDEFNRFNNIVATILEFNAEGYLKTKHPKIAHSLTVVWPHREISEYLHNSPGDMLDSIYPSLHGDYNVVDVLRLRLWGNHHMGWEYMDSVSLYRDCGCSIWQAIVGSIIHSPVTSFDPDLNVIKSQFLRAQILSEVKGHRSKDGTLSTRVTFSLDGIAEVGRLPLEGRIVMLHVPEDVLDIMKMQNNVECHEREDNTPADSETVTLASVDEIEVMGMLQGL
ncbi:hypothetical protein Moror_8426 [Moniliophthora roreri MCA 2997]|uniref:Uncharacterized protein n=1 Tax=Moniliophthora roreri (strain MCA 2997) TaxID=1381753 RepID=V2WN75_MONRO|nr:hypothetical protein Moror_8426 [Moniliophthora roreri MCA 2997]